MKAKKLQSPAANKNLKPKENFFLIKLVICFSRRKAGLGFITFFPPSRLSSLLWRTSWKVMKNKNNPE
jgi:hypothetical protein